MIENDEQINIDLLQDEILKIQYLLTYGHSPYVFIVSDKKYIRDYIEQTLASKTDIIIPLEDYNLSSPSYYLDYLHKSNVLLLNIISYEEQLEKIFQENQCKLSGNAFYYCLVFPREMIIETKHGLIMVCDEKLILKILNSNQSLASVSHMFFLDDVLKQKKGEEQGLRRGKNAYCKSKCY